MVQHRSTLQILFLVLNVVWGSTYLGYAMSYFNAATDTIKVQFWIDSNANAIVGMLNALFPIGAAIGALCSAQFLAVLSMRHSLMAADLIGTCGCLLQLNFNIGTLIPARIIVGFAVGLNSAFVPQYINQFSPISLSGSMGALYQTTMNIGIFIALALGIGFNAAGTESSYLRVVFVIPVAMCIIRSLFLILIFRDEPPKYYMTIGKPIETKRVLTKLYKEQYVDELFNEMKQLSQAETKERYSYKDMIMTDIRVRVLVGSGLSLLQQFCGISAISFYSTSIFQDYYPDNKNYLNIGVGATNCIFSVLVIPILKKFGRRFLLLYGTILISAILSVQALMAYFVSHSIIGSPIVVIILIFIYLAVFQLSLGPVVWIYIADILPDKGVSIAVLANWTSCAVIGQVFPILSNSGLDLCFLLFAIFCIIGIAFIYFQVPEVKDKTYAEIEQAFQSSYKTVSATSV